MFIGELISALDNQLGILPHAGVGYLGGLESPGCDQRWWPKHPLQLWTSQLHDIVQMTRTKIFPQTGNSKIEGCLPKNAEKMFL